MDFLGLNRQALRRIVIAVYCATIGVCVSVVMFHLYVPNKNALGALSSVCMDVLCILILIILICSFVFDNYQSNRTTRMFASLLLATIWAIFLDFLNWAFDGSLAFGHLTFWFTLGSLCMGAVLAGVFSLYLGCYMEEMHNLEQIHLLARICAIANAVSFVVTFVLAIRGTAFRFVNGHYETGEFYDVVAIIPVLTLLVLTGCIVRFYRKVGLHDVFAVAGYIFFMIAGAMIESFYRIGTTYVAVAIADIFIFVMLQNVVIAQEKRNVLEWMKKSNTDELTGFYNRHAYEADLLAMEEGGIADDFVYVSADVNSLKVVNDSIGHNAGDELLIGAADCLRRCLASYGKLYRIGGDEFIALLHIDANRLKLVQNNIDTLTSQWSGKLVHTLAISCGYVTREEAKDMSVRDMAILADQRMYEAKNEYYRKNGIERRKK